MSSLAILTDENGNFIGEKDRYMLEKGDIIAISSLLIENPRGEVLIAQRALDKKHDPGLWGPSAAGTLEPGETFEISVIKEAEEEIGLKDFTPKEVHRIQYWRDDGTGRYAVWYHAAVDLPLDYFRLQDEEVAAIRWVAKNDLLREIEADPENFVGWPERWKLMLELA